MFSKVLATLREHLEAEAWLGVVQDADFSFNPPHRGIFEQDDCVTYFLQPSKSSRTTARPLTVSQRIANSQHPPREPLPEEHPGAHDSTPKTAQKYGEQTTIDEELPQDLHAWNWDKGTSFRFRQGMDAIFVCGAVLDTIYI